MTRTESPDREIHILYQSGGRRETMCSDDSIDEYPVSVTNDVFIATCQDCIDIWEEAADA